MTTLSIFMTTLSIFYNPIDSVWFADKVMVPHTLLPSDNKMFYERLSENYHQNLSII